jgi:hypothetical protein
VGVVRRVVRWTLGVVVGLVLVAIVFAVVDNTGSKAKTRLAAGGSRSNPVQLHVAGGAWDGWRLRIVSVTPNAVSLLGRERQRIPPGGQELMVSIAATLKAGGHAPLKDLLDRLYVDGSHNAFYSADRGDLNCAKSLTPSRLVRPLNETGVLVFSERTVRGHLCFQIARNDARSVALYVNRPGCDTSPTYETCRKQVWFALR